jgi:hypothetical protein
MTASVGQFYIIGELSEPFNLRPTKENETDFPYVSALLWSTHNLRQNRC